MVFTIYNICFPSIFHLFSIYFPHVVYHFPAIFHTCVTCAIFFGMYFPLKDIHIKDIPIIIPRKNPYIFAMYFPICHQKHPWQHHISTFPSQATSALWPPVPHGSAAQPSPLSRRCGRCSDDGTGGVVAAGGDINPIRLAEESIFIDFSWILMMRFYL